MGEDSTTSKKKGAAAGQYTHWARPKWIRMYNYNYEFGESYYRPQVRYMSNSRYSSDLNSSSSFSSSSSVADNIRRAYTARRRAISPPKALSFIERWSADPFYGRGFLGRSSSLSRAESSQRESSLYRGESAQRESSLYRGESAQRESSAYRGESAQRESSAYRAESRERDVSSQYRSTRAESTERESSEYRSTRASSELRSRRAQSEYSRELADNSNYASSNLLQQINNARATSIALQEESAAVQARLHQRRARSMEALRRAEMDYYTATGASDDCLMRSDALDSERRSRREQSVLSDIDARYQREGSLTRKTLVVDNENILRGQTLDNTFQYEYPRQHLVCTENCPLFSDPVHHRRFVIGNRYLDAAALGGFDVLFDPTVYKKTRKLLSRLSEERDVESSVYESNRESSLERGRSRYSYNTIY